MGQNKLEINKTLSKNVTTLFKLWRREKIELHYRIEMFPQHYMIQADGHTVKRYGGFFVELVQQPSPCPRLPLGSVIYKYAFNPHYWSVFDF